MSNEFWDESYRSGGFLRMWDYKVPTQELVATVAALNLPAGANALDIGCGAGREAIFLAQCGFRTIGVDFAPTALAIAADRALRAGVRIQWRTGSALALPVPDASIDFATDRGCFHHVDEADRPAYARELARVLRPGGRFLLRGCRRDDMPSRPRSSTATSGRSGSCAGRCCPSRSRPIRARSIRIWWC
jgi:ubiquinone/menaquinone biosynthesis C-methylase UbiE